MTTPPAWEVAWNEAQPRLSQIRESLQQNGAVRARIVRVGQLDSELLDLELVQILQEPVKKAISLVNSSFRSKFEAELSLLIRLILYKLSMWDTGASYGAKLQDLRYTSSTVPGSPTSPSGLPRRKLLIHGILSILVPYIYGRVRTHALSCSWPDAPASDTRRKAWDTLTSLESIHSAISLLSFIAFMWDGRYRTITDRLLRMKLVPSRRHVRRDVSYEFMNRQMVWHAFTEFILFLLPLINARSMRQRIQRMKSHATPQNLLSLLPSPARQILGLSSNVKTSAVPQGTRGKYWGLPKDQCAVCAENASFNLNPNDTSNAFSSIAATVSSQGPSDETPNNPETEPLAYPIYTPYMASCGDIYCYHCIATRLISVAEGDGKDSGWECIRCGQIVTEASRVQVEIDLASESSEVSSDMGTMESLGSLTGSVVSDEYEY